MNTTHHLDWQTKKLGEVCLIELGKTPYRGNKKFWDAEKKTKNVWLSIADLLNADENLITDSKEYISDEGAKLCKVVKKGTLLVSFKLTLGRLAFAGKDLFTNEAIAALTIKNKEEISKDYLYHFLNFFDWHAAVKGDVKIKGKTLNKAKLKEIQIPLPPLPTQKRIVKILDDAFAAAERAREIAERNLANAKELFESYLQSVFDNQKYKKKKLGDIAQHSLGKMLDKAKNRGEMKPYLRNTNVRWFGFDLSDLKMMRFQENEVEQYMAVKGDVLICEGGYPGRAAIWIEEHPTYFQKAIHRVRFKTLNEGKWFLYYLYLSHRTGELKKYLTGTGILHFTGTALDSFVLPTASLSEQKQIVTRLDHLSTETKKLERIYQQKLDCLAELKKSILAKAFAGKL